MVAGTKQYDLTKELRVQRLVAPSTAGSPSSSSSGSYSLRTGRTKVVSLCKPFSNALRRGAAARARGWGQVGMSRGTIWP
jgi:hypothetical protein